MSSLNVQKKVGSSAWGIPRATNVFHDSSDVGLFSTSLPVLPHKKCKPEIIFLIEQIGIIQNVYLDTFSPIIFIVHMQ